MHGIVEKADQVDALLKLEEIDLNSAKSIMLEFANNTGLEAGKDPRRYLWTDAFAVCNFLDLFHKTGDTRFRNLATSLIAQAHEILGKHRKDDTSKRSGWLSGLSAEQGAEHPTAIGLRIGKKLPERGKAELYDDDDEWDRDGQYYHYATKWMQALTNAAKTLNEPKYHAWAVEMAKGIHPHFVRGQRMVWKMSVDLKSPQVPSMGHHDPLDGFLTYATLDTIKYSGVQVQSLAPELDHLRQIMRGKDWATDDSLGLGGILCDAFRSFNLYLSTARLEFSEMTVNLLRASQKSLRSMLRHDRFDSPASRRLAFRELGLSIGLRSIVRLKVSLLDEEKASKFAESDRLEILNLVDGILDKAGLIGEIESFWGNTVNQRERTWTEHLDINMVMLATSFCPDGFLDFE